MTLAIKSICAAVLAAVLYAQSFPHVSGSEPRSSPAGSGGLRPGQADTATDRPVDAESPGLPMKRLNPEQRQRLLDSVETGGEAWSREDAAETTHGQ